MSPIIVRPEAPGDETAIHALHRFAFGSDAEANLVDESRDEGAAVLSLAALEDERIVGHVLYSRVTIDSASNGVSALAPVSVNPRYQGRGIGSKLIEEAHRQLKADGEALVFVLGDPGYYTRFGFSVEAAKPFHTPYDGSFMMALQLAPHAPSSGTVNYPAPFARLG
jgi:putative acetyltransferase